MTFASVSFLIFLAAVIVTEPLSRFGRNSYLAGVSLVFYSFAGLNLVLLLLVSAVCDHVLSRRFSSENRLWWLILAIAINLFFLIGVKSYYYFDTSLATEMNLIPLGISFYALQSISYLIDIYNGRAQRIERFVEYLSFLSFFPQLISGPIERCNALRPQLENFHLVGVTKGLPAIRIFCIGIFLKLVVANRLAGPISEISESTIFDTVFLLNGILVMIYVYTDFFAYTLMARGVAGLFGVNLSLNFDRPFSRKNLTAFWNSWHMSLTKWMIDYFYIPIMKRISSSRLNRIIFAAVTMILVGLWHGFGLNYILFGAINGIMMQVLPALDRLSQNSRVRLPKFNSRLGVIATLAVSANIFLGGTSEQFQAFTSLSSYAWFNLDSLSLYKSMSFAVGLAGLIPLIIHEFSKASYFYQPMSIKADLAVIAAFLIATALLYTEGGAHVYFAF